MCYTRTMCDKLVAMDDPSTVGVRELRNQVAALVRRAGAGDRVVITVDGRPVAQLSPLDPIGAPQIDDLVAAGLLVPPGRRDMPEAPDPAVLPVDVRAESIIAEVRGLSLIHI